MKKCGFTKPKLFNIKLKTGNNPTTTNSPPVPAATNSITPISCSLKFDDTIELFSDDVSKTPPIKQPTDGCASCSAFLPLIQSLLDRVCRLESTHDTSFNHIEKIESVINMLANNTRSIDFKLAELSAKLSSPYPTSTTAPPTPATRRLPTAEARKSAELRQPGHTPASQLPTKSSLVNSGVATAPKPSQPSFQPSKCIVISSTNTNKEHMTSIDQDELRKTISKNHGPLIIDSIRRYKFRTENPRFMVQLGSAEDVTKVSEVPQLEPLFYQQRFLLA